ncbi:FG-GAP repeat domain-containing protein [Streptomyces sp. NPDC057271]|uniref:FG-GAP repeat domain-containing protein n=1 Tax=unclassified Streptomyces TaxID=2593676 RepID=UPI003625B9CC
MHHTHHRRRAHRLAACTALALGMGLIPAGPVFAGPVSAAVAAPLADSPAAQASTATGAKPRFDRDGDGRSDRLHRSAATGKLTVVLSSTGTSAPFSIGANDLQGAVPKEILSADDLWGTDAPELLTLHSDGALQMHSTVSPTSTDKALVWQGGGWHIYNKVLAPGDLTKDGFQDLLARTPDGTLYLYAAKGTAFDYTGPFKTRVKVGGGWQIYDQLVGANDLDGDSIADLVARTLAGDLYFYKGTGSATAPFKARVRIGGGWNTYNQIIGVDDLDGDRKADLLARTYGGAFYRYLSTGGGKFATRTYIGGGGQNLSYHLGQGGVPAYGKHNLLAVDKAGTAFTYGTQADGKFAARRQYGGTGEHVHDVWRLTNGYGLDEADQAVVLTAYNPGLSSDRGDVSDSPDFYGKYAETVSPGDVTNDGKGDIIGLDAWGNLFLHAGLKYRVPPRVSDTAVKVGTGWHAELLVAPGDVTGDGRPDLITRYDNRLYVHAGTGSAKTPFAARVLIGAGWSTYEHLAAPGDMNGDGRADLVGVTPGGDVYRYAATGLGGTATFTARVKIATGWKYDHVS